MWEKHIKQTLAVFCFASLVVGFLGVFFAEYRQFYDNLKCETQ